MTLDSRGSEGGCCATMLESSLGVESPGAYVD